ncbi:unnamed protein product [Cuscuta campestris]|uniref:Uncharacterized protein n=1 Tax=Cuscuta campestris TaxID=132261 RepID=A0A484KE42_9ASTE|nr:unnamed protein product [Cuscuta campestris]
MLYSDLQKYSQIFFLGKGAPFLSVLFLLYVVLVVTLFLLCFFALIGVNNHVYDCPSFLFPFHLFSALKIPSVTGTIYH